MKLLTAEPTRLTRIGAEQHRRLKIRAALERKAMIQLLNHLVDGLGIDAEELTNGKPVKK